MSTSPIERRLISLRLLGTPEETEELALLEEYCGEWKTGGAKAFAAKRNAERARQLRNHYELRVKLQKQI